MPAQKQIREKSHRISEISTAFEIIEGKRRNSKLLHSINEKQLYVRNKTLVDSVAFTCQITNCNARVYVIGEMCYFSQPFLGHEHRENDIGDLKMS